MNVEQEVDGKSKGASDKVDSVQRSIKTGRWLVEERLLLRLVTWGVLLALAVAVVLLRLQRLDELPPGLFVDEDRDGLAALRVLQGEYAVFFPDVGHGREPWPIYVLALSTLLFGRTLLAMHLPTALGSAGMVFAVFWMGRLLFGRDEEGGQASPWRGLLVGGVAAGLMAVSIGQTILGRTAYNKTTFMPLFLTLCLGLLWWGWKERRRRWVVLAGLCAGILPYTYMAARFVPVLLLSYGLSFLTPSRAVNWERVKSEIPWATVFLGAAALVAGPLLIHFALYPEHFFLRSQKLWVFASKINLGDPLGVFLTNVLEHLAVLGVEGDPSWRNNYAGRPMLYPWEAAFFLVGVGRAVFCWRRSTYRLLLLWLVIMVLPAFLARDDLAPSTMRMLGAAPSIYLLLGVGVWEVFRFLKERFFTAHGTKAAIAVGSVVVISLLIQGIFTHRTYFTQWANVPEVHALYMAEVMEMMEAQEPNISRPGVVYLLPEIHGDHGLRYLYDGPPFHILHAAEPDLPQAVESATAGQGELAAVKVVEWGQIEVLEKGHMTVWNTDEPIRFVFLLSKYGRYQGSEAYDDHRIHSFTDVSVEHNWRFYEELEPLTVNYDGGIALQGLALGQGPEQMSVQQALELGRDRPMWMVMRWHITPELDIDYAFSLRLYNAEGERSFQQDGVLWNPVHQPTSDWSGQEPVDTTGLLTFPTDLPAGDYELRIVVYDFETQVPTVEIGVWEPETALARLRLAEVQ